MLATARARTVGVEHHNVALIASNQHLQCGISRNILNKHLRLHWPIQLVAPTRVK